MKKRQAMKRRNKENLTLKNSNDGSWILRRSRIRKNDNRLAYLILYLWSGVCVLVLRYTSVTNI